MSSRRILSHTSGTPCARLSRPSLEISKPSLSSHSWKRLSQAFPVRWRWPRPHRRRPMCATTSTCSPHSDFWALQETHLPGIGQMAAAFQGAEVVGQHHAANRSGVAIAGTLRISSSVPTEFESMLEEAAVLAPEGVEHPLHYLRSRILARHTHAMLKRGVALVTVYLEPGLRASGLSLCWRLASSASTDPGSQWATGTWSRKICPRPARHGQRQGFRPLGSNPCRRSGRGSRPLRAVRGDGQSGATGRSGRQLSHYPTLASQTHSHVLGSQSLGSKTAEAVPHGGAGGTATRGGTLRLGLGRGTSCRSGAVVAGMAARSRSSAAAFTTSAESSEAFPGEEQRVGHRARLSRPGHAQRHGGGAAAKRPRLGAPYDASWRRWSAAWPPGGRGEPRSARYNGQSTRLLQFRCPTLALGIQAGNFRRKKPWHTLHAKLQHVGTGHSSSHGSRFSSRVNRNKQSMLRLQIRPVAGGNARRTLAMGRQAQHVASPRLAIHDGEVGGLAGPELLVEQMGTWFMVGYAQSQCQAAGRPGGLGRDIAKKLTRRGRRCLQNMQEHSRTGSRLHQPQGYFASASRNSSSVHRSAHGLRGKVGQTFVVVSHDGSEAQAIRRSSHNWLHCCPVSATEAAGTKVGETMRPTSGTARARRATEPLGRTRSWWRQRRSGSSRRPPCCWTWPNFRNMSGTITSGKKVGKYSFCLWILWTKTIKILRRST